MLQIFILYSLLQPLHWKRLKASLIFELQEILKRFPRIVWFLILPLFVSKVESSISIVDSNDRQLCRWDNALY
ncbi:hypothetical protein CUMW_142080 [Citrus unshiu]|nr:hypothetical protein CUMW_142080 [Citrus unshiu]